MDTWSYINSTLDLIETQSENSVGSVSHSYMFGYLQSHIKGVLNSLEKTLTPQQISILNMELDALKRRVEYKS